MKQQSMILRTKKRLSENRWNSAILGLSLVGFLAIFSLLIRLPAWSRAYGVVRGDIPVTPLDTTKLNSQEIDTQTPVVVIGYDAFYFGDLVAFTGDFSKVNNKFLVRHQEREPQLGSLIRDMKQWEMDRKKGESDILILAPASAVPMPVVLQVMARLKEHTPYKRIILADGLR